MSKTEEHPLFQKYLNDPTCIFLADGTEMLSNSKNAIAAIFKDVSEDRHPEDPVFNAHVIDQDGGSDAWYGVIEEIPNNATEEDLREVFRQGLVGDFGRVYRDIFGLADAYKNHLSPRY